MSELFAPSEATIRLAAFLAVFGGMALFELWSPRLERAEMAGAFKSRRWLTNLSLVILSSVMVRILFPAAAVGAALWAQANGWGLFHLAGLAPVLAGIAAFDYALREINANGVFGELYLRYFPISYF